MRNLYTVTAAPKFPVEKPPPPLHVVAPTAPAAIRKAQANLYKDRSSVPPRLEWSAVKIASNILI